MRNTRLKCDGSMNIPDGRVYTAAARVGGRVCACAQQRTASSSKRAWSSEGQDNKRLGQRQRPINSMRISTRRPLPRIRPWPEPLHHPAAPDTLFDENSGFIRITPQFLRRLFQRQPLQPALGSVLMGWHQEEIWFDDRLSGKTVCAALNWKASTRESAEDRRSAGAHWHARHVLGAFREKAPYPKCPSYNKVRGISRGLSGWNPPTSGSTTTSLIGSVSDFRRASHEPGKPRKKGFR